jgi:hypothetical protein
MRPTRRSPIDQLRTAIDSLPPATRRAMLDGVRADEIIVGAYADRRGGVCPMLAAHRRGGRTSFLGFARAWDRFARADGRSRRASERELGVLVAHLEASILAEELPAGGLAAAIADHRRLLDRPRGRPGSARPGDPDRARELAGRPGWSWLRPFRSYDDYARALARVDSAGGERAPEPELVPA